MLMTAGLLFVFAALFGSIILFAILNGNETPKVAVFIHGLIAATALLMIILYAYSQPVGNLLLASIAVFILAALGGLTMFVMDMMGKPIPKKLAIVHPIAAAIGLILLVAYIIAT